MTNQPHRAVFVFYFQIKNEIVQITSDKKVIEIDTI